MSHCFNFLASFALVFTTQYIYAIPPTNIPSHLLGKYTLQKQIPVIYRYSNDSYPPEKPIVYTRVEVNHLIQRAKSRKMLYYKQTDLFLYSALEDFPIQNKSVGILGSVKPWYESISLVFGAYPTTIEYNKIISKTNRIVTMTVDEYRKKPIQFDILFSISSFEHDGLGRYGDSLDPDGDFRAMREAKKMLKKGGLLYLAVPIGADCLVWNLHRIYGKLRLPLLLKGWKVIKTYGFSKTLFQNPLGKYIQPVFVLQQEE